MENAQPVFDNKFFTPEEAIHNGKNIIWIRFPKDYTLIKMLKSAAKARWSNTQKSWYVTDNSANRERFGLDKKIVGKEVLLKIHPNNLAPFQTYQNQLLLKGFSQNTIRVYSLEFAQLLYTLRSFPVHELTREKLKSYFLYCHQELKLSENQIHSRMNAVKFYFEKSPASRQNFLRYSPTQKTTTPAKSPQHHRNSKAAERHRKSKTQTHSAVMLRHGPAC